MVALPVRVGEAGIALASTAMTPTIIFTNHSIPCSVKRSAIFQVIKPSRQKAFLHS